MVVFAVLFSLYVGSFTIVKAEPPANAQVPGLESVSLINPDLDSGAIDGILKKVTIVSTDKEANPKEGDQVYFIGDKWKLKVVNNANGAFRSKLFVTSVDATTRKPVGQEMEVRGITFLGDKSYIIHFDH